MGAGHRNAHTANGQSRRPRGGLGPRVAVAPCCVLQGGLLVCNAGMSVPVHCRMQVEREREPRAARKTFWCRYTA